MVSKAHRQHLIKIREHKVEDKLLMDSPQIKVNREHKAKIRVICGQNIPFKMDNDRKTKIRVKSESN